MWRLTFVAHAAGHYGSWADQLSLGEPSNVGPRRSEERDEERDREIDQERRMRVAVSPEGQMDLMDRVDNLAYRQAGDSSHHRGHGPSEQYEDYQYRRAEHAGAHNTHYKRRPRRKESLFWKGMSLAQSAGSLGASLASEARQRTHNLPPEDEYGAPKDHYHSCAYSGGTCECKTGEVRYGARDSDSWTHPAPVGNAKEVTCTLEELRKKAIVEPVTESNEDPVCECVERYVFIWQDAGVSATSFQDLDSDGELDERSEATGQKKCMVPLAASKEHAPGQLEADQVFERSQVVFEECNTDDPNQEWIVLLSSGQLRNVASKQCLTADYGFENHNQRIRMEDCDMVDSQLRTQRWTLPMYVTSPQNPFQMGSGPIRMTYGGHNSDAQCLDSDLTDSFIGTCHLIAGSVEYTVEASRGQHAWQGCATDYSRCDCVGEMRLGYESERRACEGQEFSVDKPEDCDEHSTSSWTHAVPIYSDEMMCSITTMREAYMPEPSVKGVGELGEPECECRHDAFNDGEGDKEEAAELDAEETPAEEMEETESPEPQDPKAKAAAAKKKASLTKEQQMMAAGAGVVVLLGGFFLWKRSQGANPAYAEEYEGEEEEEEYAEE